MAINFPATPTLNEVYTYAGRSWMWDGTAWNMQYTLANTVVGNSSFGNTFLVSYTGMSNPQIFTGGVLQTNATFNTVIVGPYEIAAGNTLIITANSRLVII